MKDIVQAQSAPSKHGKKSSKDASTPTEKTPVVQPPGQRLRPRTPLDLGDGPSEREGGEGQRIVFPPVRPEDLPADIVLARLRKLDLRVTGSGPWQAICPAHADTKPSLSLTETAEGVLLLHCWGGCRSEDVLEKLDLRYKHLWPSRYAFQFSKRRPQSPLHFCGGSGTDSAEIIEPTPEECAEWKRLLNRWKAPSYALNQLAVRLRLPYQALLALRVGYNPDADDGDGCWIFPERDDKGRIVGLVRRYHNGSKQAKDGSKRGLTIPRYGHELPVGPVYLCEGASDTAALYSVGTLAFGRFSATGSALERLWLVRLLSRHNDREIVVVGDTEMGGTGVRGAQALAEYLESALDRPVKWALPKRPYKDVREQIVAGKWKRGLSVQEVQS